MAAGMKRKGGKRGKKAWRSIDTSEARQHLGGPGQRMSDYSIFVFTSCIFYTFQVTDTLAEQSRQQRLGLNFEAVPDADLFYVDKVTWSRLPVGFSIRSLRAAHWLQGGIALISLRCFFVPRAWTTR